MLEDLEKIKLRKIGTSQLATLCDIGARHGLARLAISIQRQRRLSISARARQSLRRHLRRELMGITRPCFELEKTSYRLARQALGPIGPEEGSQLSLAGKRPRDRLLPMLDRFPVLARTWLLLIAQWERHIIEVMKRFLRDRTIIGRSFFGRTIEANVFDLRVGLSEPHLGGRSVVRIAIGTHWLIYKPRPGWGEWEWSQIVDSMNRHSMEPKLRATKVLPRHDYCWMEDIGCQPCQSEAEAHRFFQRLGGLIAAAYLLKAVDCHRENLIADGEYPVLVDTDALWHVSPLTRTQSPDTLLYRTGFFPSRKRRSLQSQSSVLGPARTGFHLPRLCGRLLKPAVFADDVVTGFEAGWKCLLGSSSQRASFRKRVERIRSRKRRWIYLATANYIAIKRASLQPPVMRSLEERDALIRRLCQRPIVRPAIWKSEVASLRQLDIPYFLLKIDESMPPEQPASLPDLAAAIRRSLAF